MIDELKELANTLLHLPDLALWGIAALLFYKVTIIGSIYGVLRLGIQRAYEYGVARKTQRVDIEPHIRSIAIDHDGTGERLIAQITRLAGKGLKFGSQYIHSESVQWLREAIDAKEAEERRAKQEKETKA